jgi:hypothetical protein
MNRKLLCNAGLVEYYFVISALVAAEARCILTKTKHDIVNYIVSSYDGLVSGARAASTRNKFKTETRVPPPPENRTSTVRGR